MTHRRLSGDWVGCGRGEHPETWLRSWRQEKRANFCPSWTPPEWVHGPGSVSYGALSVTRGSCQQFGESPEAAP